MSKSATQVREFVSGSIFCVSAAVGGFPLVANTATGGALEFLPIAYVLSIVGAVWYLSGRLTRIETRLDAMERQREQP